MASWIVHLRIADILAKDLNVNYAKFIVGNLAPDSGVILKDGTYSPPSSVTHWRNNTSIQPDEFYKAYLIKCNDDRSFYLGYFSHLITDFHWNIKIKKIFVKYGFELNINNRQKIYSNNYFIDMKFLQQHPNMRALNILNSDIILDNTYLDYFTNDEIIYKMKSIYQVYNNDVLPERKSDYITIEDIDVFVNDTADIIRSKIRAFNDDTFADSTQALC